MDDNPAVPDGSRPASEAAPVEIEPVGRPRRLGATAVDLLILCASLFLAFFSLFTAFSPMIDPGSYAVFLIPILALILGAVVFFAINFRLLRKHGQTVGKYVFKIKIVRSNGTSASVWRILLGGAIRCRNNRIYDTIVVKA